MRRVRLAALGALVLLLALATGLTLTDPLSSDFSLAAPSVGEFPGPSFRHPLGVDALYRDTFARLLHGGAASLLVGTVGALIAMLAGTALGTVAAWSHVRGKGWADRLILRGVDALIAMPYLLIASIAGVLIAPKTPWGLTLVLGLVAATMPVRPVRSDALAALGGPVIRAVECLGSSPPRTLSLHLRRLLRPELVSLFSLMATQMVLAEAALGFLGAGLGPPAATWGRMIHESRALWHTAPLTLLAPAGATFALSLLIHQLGEASSVASLSLKRPPLWLLVPAALLALGFVPPSHELNAPPPRADGILRISARSDVRDFYPPTAHDATSIEVNSLLYDRFFDVSPDGLVSRLALSLTPNETFTRFALTLREGRFHDGREFSAALVKASVERALRLGAQTPVAASLRGLHGLQAFERGDSPEVAGLVVDNDHQLTWLFDAPTPRLGIVLASPQLSPTCTANAAPCGAGPFRFVSRAPGEAIDLVRHTSAPRPTPGNIEQLRIVVGVRPESVLERLTRGELSLARGMASSDAALVLAARGKSLQAQRFGLASVGGLFLNTKHPPFDQRDVRRALSVWLDRERILHGLNPLAIPSGALIPDALLPRSIPNPSVSDAERDQAKATLSAVAPASLTYIVPADSLEEQIAQRVQQRLAEVGWTITIDALSFAAYLDRAGSGAASMGSVGWTYDVPDPLDLMSSALAPPAPGQTRSQNYAYYRSPSFDQHLARCQRFEAPSSALVDCTLALEQEVLSDAPWVVLYERTELMVSGPDLIWPPSLTFPVDWASFQWSERR